MPHTNPNRRALHALRAAFPLTLPVMAGFLFLGVAYGVLMSSLGLGVFWTFLMSWLVFAGSMQYVALTLFAAAFNPLYALFVTLMVNARHVFYGLSMLDKMKNAGRWRPYVIFALCDETFSILCSTDAPSGVDSGLFMFFTALLNRWYWILASVFGAVVGDLIKFNTTGLDFTLTALFIVIFLNQLMKPKAAGRNAERPIAAASEGVSEKYNENSAVEGSAAATVQGDGGQDMPKSFLRNTHISALIGVGCSILCLFVFGPDRFIPPAMALMLGVFALFSNKLTGGAE